MNRKQKLTHRMRIYILCGNAAFNKGDRGNLDAQIKLLQKHFPKAELILDSYRAEIDRSWYNAKVLRRGAFLSWEQIKGLAKADVVVWGGGALIADNSFRLLIPLWMAIIAFIRFVLRKPVIAWAHGVVLETKLGRVLARHIYSWIDVITVRDKNSLEAVRRLGNIGTPVHLTADPAILIQPLSPQVGAKVLSDFKIEICKSKRLFAISPTYWPIYHQSTDIFPMMLSRYIPIKRELNVHVLRQFNESLLRLVDNIVEKFQARVILLPRYPTEPWKDVQYLQTIAKRSKYPEKVYVFDRDSYSPETYLAAYHHFDFVISNALHDAIFATALDLPCIKLYYEPKGADFFRSINSEDRMLDWKCLFEPDGVEQIINRVDYTLRNWKSLLPNIQEGKIRLQRDAAANAFHLNELVNSQGIEYSDKHIRFALHEKSVS